MTDVARVAAASMDASNGMFAEQLTGNLYAGEDLDPVAPCYIKASDGKVYMSDGDAANEAAKVDGFTAKAYKSGQAVVLFTSGRFRYGSGMTPGANLYLSTTKGVLADAASVGGFSPIARAITATDIRILSRSEQAKVTKAGTAMFISSEQTGTGSSQDVPHGLGAAPVAVLVVPTELDGNAYDAAEGSHDATNVKVTVTTGAKFKVMAWL